MRAIFGCTKSVSKAAAANKLMVERRLEPYISKVFGWSDIPLADFMMLRNEYKLGNMAMLVQSPRTVLRTLEDALLGETH